jgi:hypothetical protein
MQIKMVLLVVAVIAPVVGKKVSAYAVLEGAVVALHACSAG